MKIEDIKTNNSILWKNARPLKIYRTGAGDFIVMCISERRAVAIVVNGCTSTKEGDCWEPGSESIWIPIEATLTLG